MEEKEKIIITEYKDIYKEQIIKLVGECLVDQLVLSVSCLPIEDDDLQKIPELYARRGKFWVALDGSKVVGTVGIREISGALAKLRRMFVQKEYRGTGLGQQLLDTALQFARENGYTKITLNTHKKMKRAHHFYKKNKFILVGEKKGEYKICYERNL
ncbi:MAG: GNAT family N-acetyltransferase [bacterium]